MVKASHIFYLCYSNKNDLGFWWKYFCKKIMQLKYWVFMKIVSLILRTSNMLSQVHFIFTIALQKMTGGFVKWQTWPLFKFRDNLILATVPSLHFMYYFCREKFTPPFYIIHIVLYYISVFYAYFIWKTAVPFFINIFQLCESL